MSLKDKVTLGDNIGMYREAIHINDLKEAVLELKNKLYTLDNGEFIWEDIKEIFGDFENE